MLVEFGCYCLVGGLGCCVVLVGWCSLLVVVLDWFAFD